MFLHHKKYILNFSKDSPCNNFSLGGLMGKMKNILNILAISISLSFSYDKLQDGTVSTNADVAFNSEKNLVIQFTEQYAPAYTEMLLSSYSSPNEWTSYVNGVLTPKNFNANDKNDIIDEFGTIIHESIHHKNSIHGIYIDAEHYIEYTDAEKIDTRSFFNSELIAVVLPADAKEKIFRFTTYLEKGTNVGANVDGISGLMNEYSAYQNGCSAALMAYDNALKEKDTTLAIKFFKSALANYFAYYEFNSFIGAYLKYSKSKEPLIYQKIMKQNNLRMAYTLNTIQFEKVILTINSQSSRLKSNYKLIKSSMEYYKKNYEDYAKLCMDSFQPELTSFKLQL